MSDTQFKVGDKVHVVGYPHISRTKIWTIVSITKDLHYVGEIMFELKQGTWGIIISSPADLIPAEPPATPAPVPADKRAEVLKELQHLLTTYHKIVGYAAITQQALEIAEFIDDNADVILAALSRED